MLIGARLAPDSMESHVLDALGTLGCKAHYASTAFWFNSLGSRGNAALVKATHFLFREPERLIEGALIRQAEEFQPELVLVLQGNHLSPKTVARLRTATRAKVVCWCQDHVGTLGRQYMLGAEYDAVFLKDRYMQKLFADTVTGTRFHYLPEACNPRVHRPVELTSEDRRRFGCDVMIYGSLYYYRQAILGQLDEFDLKRWGNAPSWMIHRIAGSHAGGDIVLDDKVRAVRAARIALNPLHYAEVNSLNCRTFELAGCGAFQLVTYKPVLREHFTPGIELDSFHTVPELIDKIRHYLRNPGLAAEIGRQSQIRAHRDHTYEVRLREIFRLAWNGDASRAAAPLPAFAPAAAG